MSAAVLIATKDLKLRIRDRSFIILGIVAPLTLAVIFNLVFGNAFDAGTGLGLELGVVDLDQSESSQGLSQLLEAQDDEFLTLTSFDSVATAEDAIGKDEINAFFLFEEDFSRSLTSNQAATIFVVGDIDAPTTTQIAAGFAESYGTSLDAVRIAVLTIVQLTAGPPTGNPLSAAFSYEFTDVEAATRQLDGNTYFAAAMGVFFLFFTVQFGVSGLLEEGRLGTLDRLMVAPIKKSSVIGGKAILSFALGIISMGVMVVVTSILMGAVWGAPLGVTLLVVAGVLSAVGIMGLVASVVKTPEGAGNLGAIIAVVLGMLGGVFFPIGQGDDLLSKLTFLTPHAWFMRGLGDLADDAPWTAALPATGAIMVFAVVCGAIAWVFVRRSLSR